MHVKIPLQIGSKLSFWENGHHLLNGEDNPNNHTKY